MATVLVSVVVVAGLLPASPAAAAGEAALVVPIATSLAGAPVGDPADALRLQRLLSGEGRYLLATRAADEPLVDDTAVRSVSATALADAVGSSAGGFDASVDRPAARAAAVRAVTAVAAAHRVNGGSWGGGWQTPLSASQVGMAAWLLWPSLSATTRDRVARLVAFEADAVAATGVAYYRDARGVVVRPGDTGSEEESWRARGVSLALAMMPRHARTMVWRRTLLARQEAAFAVPANVGETRALHRTPACAWLAGSNINPDGTLVNHNRIHPTYMRTPHAVMSVVHQQLAGQRVSPTAMEGVPRVYGALQRLYRSDGTITYPQGNDWGESQRALFYVHDVQMRAMGVASGALGWERLHGDGTAAGAAALGDGSVYAPGDFFATGAEQDAAAKFGEAWLTLKLAGRAPAADATLAAPPRTLGTTGCSGASGRTFRDTSGETLTSSAWTNDRGVMLGYVDGSFGPGGNVTRVQSVVTLFRAAGSPTGYPAHRFADVPATGEQAAAISWALATRITSGVTATSFSPGSPITRAQTVVLLWRAAGSVSAPRAPVPDVTGEVALAANWAYSQRITLGRTATLFDPWPRVTRGQWAVMLHREHNG